MIFFREVPLNGLYILNETSKCESMRLASPRLELCLLRRVKLEQVDNDNLYFNSVREFSQGDEWDSHYTNSATRVFYSGRWRSIDLGMGNEGDLVIGMLEGLLKEPDCTQELYEDVMRAIGDDRSCE